MTQTILEYIFEVLIILVVIGIVSSFVYGSITDDNFSEGLIVGELGLILDSTSIDNNFKGEYDLTKEKIIENKNNILTIKSKELDYPQSYSLISNLDEFSQESDKFEIK